MIPMYPQFAMSSYETVQVKAEEVLKKYFPHIKLKIAPVFYNDDDYIKVMANNIKKQFTKN